MYDATRIPNVCLQTGEGSEDCLYLNIYTPKTDEKWLPVMFWIFGGGFKLSHCNPGFYGPQYFMDKDVVIVTVSYRLGALGNVLDTLIYAFTFFILKYIINNRIFKH